LFEQADAATRRDAARRLTSYPRTPDAILRQITAGVAAPDTAAADMRHQAASEPAPTMPRTPPTAAELAELFFAADAAERRLILMYLVPPPSEAAASHPQARPETVRLLESAALSHQIDAFMRGLEQSLAIAPALAYRIVHDGLGEPLVVAAKVLGIPEDALQRMLLFVNPLIGRSVERVYELTRLFDDVDVTAARALVAIWREAAPLSRPAARGNAARSDPRPRQSIDPDRSRPRAQDAPPRPVPAQARATGNG
jgi:hypothetical protein